MEDNKNETTDWEDEAIIELTQKMGECTTTSQLEQLLEFYKNKISVLSQGFHSSQDDNLVETVAKEWVKVRTINYELELRYACERIADPLSTPEDLQYAKEIIWARNIANRIKALLPPIYNDTQYSTVLEHILQECEHPKGYFMSVEEYNSHLGNSLLDLD